MPDERERKEWPSGCPACGHAVVALEPAIDLFSFQPIGCTKAELFTTEERAVLHKARELYEVFSKLPPLHQSEIIDFSMALRRMQDLVSARPMYRALGTEQAAQEQARKSRNGEQA